MRPGLVTALLLTALAAGCTPHPTKPAQLTWQMPLDRDRQFEVTLAAR